MAWVCSAFWWRIFLFFTFNVFGSKTDHLKKSDLTRTIKPLKPSVRFLTYQQRLKPLISRFSWIYVTIVVKKRTSLWFFSFLSGRNQFVCINKIKSQITIGFNFRNTIFQSVFWWYAKFEEKKHNNPFLCRWYSYLNAVWKQNFLKWRP